LFLEEQNMALTKLKIAILEKGLTQKMVAQKAGIHESTLSQIARGTYVPDHRQKQLISRAINEEAEELFSDRSVTSESMR
jgi:transcriptional regulator with XRE-family HTH domain